MKKWLLFNLMLLLLAQTVMACDCKSLAPLTIVECRKFEFISKCKIDSVASCDGARSIAFAHPLEIYKGDLQQELKFSFDCSSACMMSFAKDEIWLLYAKKGNDNLWNISFCDRNRKYFETPAEDFNQVNLGLSFEAEIKYLKKNIGLKITDEINKPKTIDITQRENNETSGWNKLGLLGISLLLFLLMYFLMNKFLK